MTEPASPSEVTLPTDVRYGTRSLLGAMTFVACSIVAVSALVRSFPEHARPVIVAHWCIFFVLLALTVGFVAWRRYVIEREAGAVRFVLATHSYFVPKMPAIGRTLLGTLLLVSGAAMWGTESMLVASGTRPLWLQFFSWSSYVALAVSTVGITYLWWFRNVRLCEEGVVVRHMFVPWNVFERSYWDACFRDVLVLDGGQRLALKVPDEERTEVQAFVESKIESAIYRTLAIRS